MKIGVVGLGKIGLPLALVFCKAGFDVKGVDINRKVLEKIKNREYFPEPYVNSYLDSYGDRLSVSKSYETFKDVDVCFVIVPTPLSSQGILDVSYVADAVRNVHKVNSDVLVVVSSTLNPGDMDKLKLLHEKICYNPEFIAQGKIIRGFENPKFTLIGAYLREHGEIVKDIWRRVHSAPIFVVKPIEAEIIKLCSNVRFSLDITFANIVGSLCEVLNADPNVVMDIINMDLRKYRPGLGFGGPCFVKDTEAFKNICSWFNVKDGQQLADLLLKINESIVEKYALKILDSLGSDKTVAFIGVTYKPGVPYIYESQPVKIINRLLEYDPKIKIYVYDELGEKEARKKLGEKVVFCSKMPDAVRNADVIFIGVPNFFLKKKEFENKKVIDPWRCLDESV